MTPLGILVTGSRDYTYKHTVARAFIEAVMRHYPDGVPDPFDWSTVEVRHGCARGLDTIAAELGEAWGMWVVGLRADWKRHGKAAGLIRNGKLVAREPLVDQCLTFALPESVGTFDCADKARAAGIPVFDYGVSTRLEDRY